MIFEIKQWIKIIVFCFFSCSKLFCFIALLMPCSATVVVVFFTVDYFQSIIIEWKHFNCSSTNMLMWNTASCFCCVVWRFGESDLTMHAFVGKKKTIQIRSFKCFIACFTHVCILQITISSLERYEYALECVVALYFLMKTSVIHPLP